MQEGKRQFKAHTRKRIWIVLIPLIISAVTLCIWQALLLQEQVQIKRTVSAVSGSVSDQLTQRIEQDIRALARMAARWEVAGQPTRAGWEADAQHYVQDSADYQAVEWIDPGLHVRWVVPLQGNEAALNLNLSFEARRRAALTAARNERRIVLSRPINLVQGGKGFLVYVSIMHQGRFEGFITGVFRIRNLMAALPPTLPRDYCLTLTEANETIYQQGTDNYHLARVWGRQSAVTLPGVLWHVRVTPTPEMLAHSRSPLAPLVLIMGLLTALMTGFLLSATMAARTAQQAIRQSETRLAEAQHVARLGSYEYTLATGVLIWSEESCRLFDRDPSCPPPDLEELMNAYHPEDRARLLAARRQSFLDGQPYECDLRIRQRDGSYRWRRSVSRPVRDAAGNPIRIVGTLMDIHERKEAEEALRRSEARLLEAQRVAQIGFWEYHIATGEILWSEEMFRLLEFDPALGAPSYEDLMARYHPEDVPMHRAVVTKAVADGEAYEFNIRAVLTSGAVRWLHAIGNSTRNEQGRPIRLFGTMRDITETRRYQERLEAMNSWLEETNTQLIEQQAEFVSTNIHLEDLATTDGLTGLKNRRAFQERVQEEFERSRRYGASLSLMLMDVDRFKSFNDTFGHPAGDQVLKQVAAALQTAARGTDLVARYGGEEFVVLLTETDAQGAVEAAERIRTLVAEQNWELREINISIGVTTLRPATSRPAAMIQEADIALYRSKAEGRNRVSFHGAEVVSLSS